jgi:GMP synthase (glutamine-hydrolysing)
VPVLGICYGMQTMAAQLGGAGRGAAQHASSATPRCAPAATPGCSKASRTSRTAEGHGMLKVWMSHGDKVTELPPGFKLMASTPSCPIAGMADEARGYYARAVPPRGDAHGAGRARCCSRFVLRHLRLHGRLDDADDYIDEAVAAIREQVGDERGHPRAVGRCGLLRWPRALIHRAIGDQLTCVFVDHGLLRLNEGEHGDGHVRQASCTRRVIRVDASELFLGELAGVSDPEAEAQDHRPRCSSTSSRPRRAKLGKRRHACDVPGAGHHLPGRDRECRRRPRPEGARRSRATTTWAACPSSWA